MLPEPLRAHSCAVIFVDLMEAALSSVHTMPVAELRANASRLAQACALFEVPAIFALAPLPHAAVLSEITTALPHLRVVPHTTNDSWNTPAFVDAVLAAGRKQLVFAGIATDVGVALTVLSARRAGYDCAVLTDVTGTMSTRTEQAAFARLTAGGVTLSAWSSFLGEIAVDYTHGKGPAALALLRGAL